MEVRKDFLESPQFSFRGRINDTLATSTMKTRSNSFTKSTDYISPLKEKNAIIKSSSFCNKVVPEKKHTLKRTPSRYYSSESIAETKYSTPCTFIGPEFIVRATYRNKQLHMKNLKTTLKRKVLVIMLNGQKIDIVCDPLTVTAEQIYKVVIHSEDLEDNFTLGLAALVSGDFVFLPPDTRLYKVAPPGWTVSSKKNPMKTFHFTLYIRVKFFLPSLRGLRIWDTKHQLYLQLRRSLLERYISCSLSQHIRLAGFALQAEFGDFLKTHDKEEYFLLEHYIPEVFLPLENEYEVKCDMKYFHKQHSGMDPGRAEEAFISHVQQLPTYGNHYFSATLIDKDAVNTPIWFTVNGEGISFYRDSEECENKVLQQFFQWKQIKKLSFNKEHLLLSTTTSTEENCTNYIKYKLRMECRKSYYAFHLASLHHQFFLKLRIEFSSLSSLSQEFGVHSAKHNAEKLYNVVDNNPSKVTELDKLQYKLFTPSSSTRRNIKCHDMCMENKIINGLRMNIEESQNKENENPLTRKPCTKLITNPLRKRQLDCKTVVANVTTAPRVHVKMGTRAISCSAQRNLLSDYDVKAKEIKVEETVEEISGGAYVLNSSIKSVDEKLEFNFHETLSRSLIEKIDNMSFEDERILSTVRLQRDKSGSLGIQITEGCDGGLYIQSVHPDGSAAKSGTIYKGDQLISVNGHSILNMKFSCAINLIHSQTGELELVLSQIVKSKSVYDNISSSSKDASSIDRKTSNKIGTTVDAVEYSYINSIRYTPSSESESRDSHMLYTPVPKRSSSHRSDGIRAVCCVLPPEDDFDLCFL